MNKRTIALIAVVAITLVVAVVTGISDLSDNSAGVLCGDDTCAKVHSSSVATVFGVPIGFFAGGFLFLVLMLYWFRKERLGIMLLWALAGAEAYFTVVQLIFMEALCQSCLLFFALLIVCVALTKITRPAIITGCLVFFAAHFLFFFPHASLKPTLMSYRGEASPNIEIFASPSCEHCEEALEHLEKFCTKKGARLTVRPVAISKADMAKAVEWVSGNLFACEETPMSRLLAEKVVWQNEMDAKRLNNGELAVPLIVVETNKSRQVLKGWGREALASLGRVLSVVQVAEAGQVAEVGMKSPLETPSLITGFGSGIYKAGGICKPGTSTTSCD